MKKNFKKVLSVMLVALMLCSVFSVGALAAGPYTVVIGGGTRNSPKSVAHFADRIVWAALNESTENVETIELEHKKFDKNGNLDLDANGKVQMVVSEVPVTFTFVEDGVTYTINMQDVTATFETDASGNFKFPAEYLFEMPGYNTGYVTTQANRSDPQRYSTNKASNMGAATLTGTGQKNVKITKNMNYFGYYTAINYTIDYLKGSAAGVSGNELQVKNKKYNSTQNLAGAIFEREGFVQIGWSTKDNSPTVEYELNHQKFVVTESVVFYPVWQEIKFDLDYDVEALNFATVCQDYAAQPTQTFTIKNNSNSNVTLTLPSDPAFIVTANGSLTIPAEGGVLEISVRPENNLGAGTYSANLKFDFGVDKINFTVKASFAVLEHRFENYKSNDDATYEADGTKTAMCIFGCGADNTITDVGSMRVYSIANNTVKGLLKEYLYHKTVNCSAYGSGSDYTDEEIAKATAEGKELFRFRPTSWYVNEEHNGEFADGNYKINYVHTDFGSYTLTVKYVEEKLVDGEWVATDVEDEKSFKYSIGPSAEDEQEIVRPNMIVNIIFALMAYLVDVIGGLLG